MLRLTLQIHYKFSKRYILLEMQCYQHVCDIKPEN